MKNPSVYLLCGLTGSGKTTYARTLEDQGYVRLSLDEAVYALHERDVVTYPDKFLDYEEEAKATLEQKLKELLHQGRGVALDYGFWQKTDRDRYKKLIEANGGMPKLIYFKADPEFLMKRLYERNKLTDANALTVTEPMLQDFIARFEEPVNEGEEIILQDGTST